jgi:hypothetical protein
LSAHLLHKLVEVGKRIHEIILGWIVRWEMSEGLPRSKQRTSLVNKSVVT